MGFSGFKFHITVGATMHFTVTVFLCQIKIIDDFSGFGDFKVLYLTLISIFASSSLIPESHLHG